MISCWYNLVELRSFKMKNRNRESLLLKILLYAGKSQFINLGKTNSPPSPLSFIKVSHGKNYFIAAYKSKPFEIWDLQTKTLLREVKLTSGVPITALEWSPSKFVFPFYFYIGVDFYSAQNCHCKKFVDIVEYYRSVEFVSVRNDIA